jgi:hypothetical protein
MGHPNPESMPPRFFQVCDFTVDEERRGIAIRGERGIAKMQRLSAEVVVCETGPSVRPTIYGAHQCRKLFAAEVAVVGQENR